MFGEVGDRGRAIAIDIARPCVGIAVSEDIHSMKRLLAHAHETRGSEPRIEQVNPPVRRPVLFLHPKTMIPSAEDMKFCGLSGRVPGHVQASTGVGEISLSSSAMTM